MSHLNRTTDDDRGVLQVRQLVKLFEKQERRLPRLQGESRAAWFRTLAFSSFQMQAQYSVRAWRDWFTAALSTPLIYHDICLLVRARTVRWCHRGRPASWASWWSAAWRAWPAPEAPPAPGSSKIRATATQRKRKKVKAKHVLLPLDPLPPSVCPCCSLPPLTSAPPLQPRNESTPQIVFHPLMGRFLLLFGSTITTAGATVTPLSLGRRLFISCPDLSDSLFSHTSSAPARWMCRSSCVISGLISCLLRWASGSTPCEFLSQTPDQRTVSITTRVTWHLKNRGNYN